MLGTQLRCPKCNGYKPDWCQCGKPAKGDLGGLCNRTACQQPGATWFNHSTRKHYCGECAALINRANRKEAMELFGHDLCTQAPNGLA